MKHKLLTVLILLFFLHGLKAQEIVYMPYFEVMNMHPDYQYSTSKLFSSYVEGNNKYHIILPPRPDSVSKNETLEQVKEDAARIKAKYFIMGSLNRLGEVVIISVNMYNTVDGSKTWGATLKARTPDDIDPIMQKMAGDLGSIKKSGSENENIYNVTDYDARQLNKIDATTSFGVTIGGGYTFVNHIDKNFPAGLGIMAAYDARNLIFDLKAEGYFSHVSIYSVNINILYPFTTRSNTPFLGGGLGYGGIDITKSDQIQASSSDHSTNNEGGLILMASGGYIFNRTGSVSMRVTVSPFMPLFKVGSDYPAGILFGLTILFGRQ